MPLEAEKSLSKRACGILLHPTCFPGPFGIGKLGRDAYDFIDFLERTKQTLWQILPLGPTGYGDSPYQCFSAFAGNPLLISIERLRDEGFFSDKGAGPSRDELEKAPFFPSDKVDFGPVIEWTIPMLRQSHALWKRAASEEERNKFAAFIADNKMWLDDFALFMALKEAHGGVAWNQWPRELAARDPAALDRSREQLADQIECHSYFQYQFFKQWMDVKAYANEKNIEIIGDIPIFVAYDSADVWSNPDLFYLDADGNPTVVAGVPPDYFSVTGQRWGNPHYRWDIMAQDGFQWWVERFRQTLKIVDILRIDHFRGFESYWAVPASEETAEKGEWLKGPGIDLFRAVETALGELPIIAEDLGLVTPEVKALHKATGFPGMKVLQFAFGSDRDDPFLPHNYEHETVVYTGTHDNDTVQGWFETAPEKEREAFLEYSGHPERSVHSDRQCAGPWMIRLAMESAANTVIIPLQDILGLGPEARMNTPGRAGGNWGWRYDRRMLDDEAAKRLAEETMRTGRAAVLSKLF